MSQVSDFLNGGDKAPQRMSTRRGPHVKRPVMAALQGRTQEEMATFERGSISWRAASKWISTVTLLFLMSALMSAAIKAQSAGDCRLDPFRQRIDRTLQSVTVEKEEKGTTTSKEGVPYLFSDVTFSGSLDGCVVLQGPIPDLKAGYSWLYDMPDVSLPQEHFLVIDRLAPYPLPLKPGDGNTSPRFYAQGKFEGKDGAGIRFFYPAEKSQWNGKLFLVQHGSGTYTRVGDELVSRNASDPFAPAAGQNLFIENMIDRGYAVASFRKDAIRPPSGMSEVTLRDGRVISTSFVAHVALPLAMAEFAQKHVAATMGEAPRRTYYYGHSGGGITARLINAAPGANLAKDGTPIIDGFIADDAGNGLYMPIQFRNGRDVLFSGAEDRSTFAYQIEIARQLYNPLSYLQAKRTNARLLREKSLGDKHRYYEVLGASHFDFGMTQRYSASASGQKPAARELLDLSGVVAALIDVLDSWVEKGMAPPASKADIPGFDPALSPPEVTCPLGIYYAPESGGTTRFEAFDGSSNEPEIPGPPGSFLDMNGNKKRDARETVTAAWQRLGLVGKGEAVDLQRYSTCLANASRRLIEQRLLPRGSDGWYQQQAEKKFLDSKAVLK